MRASTVDMKTKYTTLGRLRTDKRRSKIWQSCSWPKFRISEAQIPFTSETTWSTFRSI